MGTIRGERGEKTGDFPLGAGASLCRGGLGLNANLGRTDVRGGRRLDGIGAREVDQCDALFFGANDVLIRGCDGDWWVNILQPNEHDFDSEAEAIRRGL